MLRRWLQTAFRPPGAAAERGLRSQPTTTDNRILFLHIPKTAGISLFSALASAVGEDRAIRFASDTQPEREAFLRMSDEELRRYRLISGHFQLAFFLRKPIGDYQIVTVLRDPVDRVLSAFFFMKTSKSHPRNEEFAAMELSEFVAGSDRDLTNRQCIALAGSESFQSAREAIDRYRVLAAPMDYVDDFCRMLERRLRVGPLSLKHENQTAFRLRVDEISSALRSRLEALTEEDRRLYEYVRRRFEEKSLDE
jgi:hypothetical protein